MTTAAETAMTEKEQKKAEREANAAREKEMTAREAKLNEGKTGKGTRTFLGLTRGRNPLEIQYENWDDSQPDTLPKTLAEVIDVHKTRGQDGDVAEKELVRRWVLGDNSVLYSEASDPVAEFYESDWTPEYKAQFKIIVKQFATANELSIEDTVGIVKPSMVAALAKMKAKEETK